MSFKGSRPHLSDAVVAKNYLDEKELRSLGQLVSGYLDFTERQAEREQIMTMKDWAEHLDRILSMSGEKLPLPGCLTTGAYQTRQNTKDCTDCDTSSRKQKTVHCGNILPYQVCW